MLMVAGAVYADVANSCRILVWLDFVPFVACLNPRFLVNYAQRNHWMSMKAYIYRG